MRRLEVARASRRAASASGPTEPVIACIETSKDNTAALRLGVVSSVTAHNVDVLESQLHSNRYKNIMNIG